MYCLEPSVFVGDVVLVQPVLLVPALLLLTRIVTLALQQVVHIENGLVGGNLLQPECDDEAQSLVRTSALRFD